MNDKELVEAVARVRQLDEKRSHSNLMDEFRARHGRKPKLRHDGSIESAAINTQYQFFRSGYDLAQAPTIHPAIIEALGKHVIELRNLLAETAAYVAGSYEDNLRIPKHRERFDRINEALTRTQYLAEVFGGVK